MPRYYFHIHDGVSAFDRDGTDYPDRHAAGRAAVLRAAAFLVEEPHWFWSGQEWKMEVTDATGQVIFGVGFRACEGLFA